MAAGEIVISLLMKTGAFSTDVKRAEKELRELKKEAQDAGVAIGAAFAAVGLAATAMVKHAINVADETVKMAQKVGTSVEALSALAYAADLSGLSHEQLGSSMVKLSKSMSDAAQGSGDAAKAFEALGIKVANSDGSLKASDQVLTEIAGKFAGYKDGVEKTALAVAIFGKAGADMIPLLNSGAEGLDKLRAEAQELGVVLDTEAAKAAEAFNDNLSRMQAAVSGVANKAAAELLPALNQVSEMFLAVAKNEASVEVATGIVKAAVGALINVFQTVAVVGSDVGFVFLSVGREIGAWAAQINALAHGDLKGFTAISDAVKADGERARAELDKFQARVMAIGGASAAPALDNEARRLLGRGMTPPLTNAPRIGGPSAAGGRSGKAPKPFATSDRFTEADALERETQMLNEAQAAWRKWEDKATEASQKVTDAYNEHLQQLLDQGPEARLESQRQEMQLLADAFEKGTINAAQFNDAATGFLHLTAEKVSETKSMTEELGLTFASAFEDAVIGGRNASDVFKGLLQDVSRVFLRIGAIEPLMKQLKASMSGGDADGGGFFSAIASAFAGAFTGGGSLAGAGGGAGNFNFGGGFADGGSPPVGKVSLVGERGPEWFIPRTAGMVVPFSKAGAGSGGSDLTVINQTTGHVDRATKQPLPGGGTALILQELAAQIANPNSAVSQSMQRSFKLRPARS